jgi:hypothetical protein
MLQLAGTYQYSDAEHTECRSVINRWAIAATISGAMPISGDE